MVYHGVMFDDILIIKTCTVWITLKKTYVRVYFVHVMIKFVTVYVSEVASYQIHTVEFSVMHDKGGGEIVQIIKNSGCCVLCSILKVKLLLGSGPLNLKTFLSFEM